MTATLSASRMLALEARALLTRLARIKPFALHETMVPAAAASPAALAAIERFLAHGRRELRNAVLKFIRWLDSPAGRHSSPEEAQRRFTLLRLRFNTMLDQFDIFADVMTQRSEYETGTWLAGLDIVSADALTLPGAFYQPPPVICYLDRGHGAAIRRARTRLPGGGENPVAIVRVPRERMVGTGIASSLVHEVGHQGAALLDLVESLRPTLKGLQKGRDPERVAWRFYERWISEILADMWSVSRVGVAATLGLIGVVSLPRPFVFRMSLDDPHPIPWIRVKLSAAMGGVLYPHSQWSRIATLWESLYPTTDLTANVRALFRLLEETMPAFVAVLLNHRPKVLRGQSLMEVLRDPERHPTRLALLYKIWMKRPSAMRAAPPSRVFAVLGQARADNRMTPEDESRVVAGLLTYWALSSTLRTGEACAQIPLMEKDGTYERVSSRYRLNA